MQAQSANQLFFPDLSVPSESASHPPAVPQPSGALEKSESSRPLASQGALQAPQSVPQPESQAKPAQRAQPEHQRPPEAIEAESKSVWMALPNPAPTAQKEKSPPASLPPMVPTEVTGASTLPQPEPLDVTHSEEEESAPSHLQPSAVQESPEPPTLVLEQPVPQPVPSAEPSGPLAQQEQEQEQETLPKLLRPPVHPASEPQTESPC